MAVMPRLSFEWREAALALPRYLLLISAGMGAWGGCSIWAALSYVNLCVQSNQWRSTVICIPADLQVPGCGLINLQR